MRKTGIAALAFVFACALQAQTSNALVKEAEFPWTVVRDNLIKMAQKMPADAYAFKPAEGMETFGQRVAHIGGANLRICQGVMGIDKPFARPDTSSKDALVQLLKESGTACDAAFHSLNES